MSSWSKKSLGNRWLRLLQTLSCFLGVSPSPLRKQQHRHLHLTWSLILLAWLWFVGTNLLLAKSQMQVLAIEKLLYLIEYPSNMIITAIFSLRVYRSAEFFRRQSLQQKNLISLLFEDSQKYFSQLGDYVRKLLLMVCSFHGLCVVIDICWLRFDWVQTLYSNCAHNLVGLMISLSLLQYVLDLRIIQQLHLQLNERLKKTIETYRSPLNGICIVSPEYDKVEWKLEQLRLNCITLDEMRVKLLDRFGPVLLVNFVNSLLSFCYELFNVFRIVEQAKWSEDLVLFVYRLLWLLMHGSRIWSVLMANARIAEQKCQLCLLLNKLETDDTRLERNVNRFLLQLQANGGNPSTVCGVADLDTLALGGFVSALSAIVIFLIQIDLGNKSLMGYSF
ncbi:hypothetical protein ACLKA6_003701 [Drosophila palustris]